MKPVIISLLLSFLSAPLVGQINKVGSFHLAAGLSFGLHGTYFEEVISVTGIQSTNTANDEAITVTIPVDVQFGLIKPLSVGAYVEPGMFITNDQNVSNSNALFIAGVKPRLYLVQNDGFAWMLDGRFGMNFLNVEDLSELSLENSSRYSGPHFGVGSGIGKYGGVVGFNIGLVYVRNSFTLQNPSANIVNSSQVSGELDTEGLQLNAQLAVHF